MKDFIKEKFKAIIYGEMRMYFIKTAKEIVEVCKEHNIKIFGLEALKLTGDGIQPSMEHSVQFNDEDDSWKKAAQFLSEVKDTSYVYEIYYENY